MDRLTFCEFDVHSLFYFLVRHTQETLLSFRATLILNFLFVVLSYIPNAPISPCAIAYPFFVMLNNMSSHVYRNLRFGFYRDQSITSSVVDQALQRHHEIVFANVTPTKIEEKGDVEAGDTTETNGSLAQETEGRKMEV